MENGKKFNHWTGGSSPSVGFADRRYGQRFIRDRNRMDTASIC